MQSQNFYQLRFNSASPPHLAILLLHGPAMKRSDLIYAATFGSASKFALKAKRFLNSANIESSNWLSLSKIRMLHRCDSYILSHTEWKWHDLMKAVPNRYMWSKISQNIKSTYVKVSPATNLQPSMYASSCFNCGFNVLLQYSSRLSKGVLKWNWC